MHNFFDKIKRYVIVNNTTGDIYDIIPEGVLLISDEEERKKNNLDAYVVTNPDDFIPGISKYSINTDNSVTFINTGKIYDDYIRENNRKDRCNLLKAFDLWEKAVVRGREEDSDEIMQWYRDILDLKPEAFDNIPDRIKYYMGGN